MAWKIVFHSMRAAVESAQREPEKYRPIAIVRARKPGHFRRRHLAEGQRIPQGYSRSEVVAIVEKDGSVSH